MLFSKFVLKGYILWKQRIIGHSIGQMFSLSSVQWGMFEAVSDKWSLLVVSASVKVYLFSLDSKQV